MPPISSIVKGQDALLNVIRIPGRNTPGDCPHDQSVQRQCIFSKAPKVSRKNATKTGAVSSVCRISLYYSLKLNAYEKEKIRKLCKIGQNAWQCRIFYLLLPMSTRRGVEESFLMYILGAILAFSTLIVGLVLTNKKTEKQIMGMYIMFMLIAVPCIIFLLYCLTPSGKNWLRQNNML